MAKKKKEATAAVTTTTTTSIPAPSQDANSNTSAAIKEGVLVKFYHQGELDHIAVSNPIEATICEVINEVKKEVAIQYTHPNYGTYTFHKVSFAGTQILQQPYWDFIK